MVLWWGGRARSIQHTRRPDRRPRQRKRAKARDPDRTHSSTGPHITFHPLPRHRQSLRRGPLSGDSRLCPVASEGRPCPSPTSLAFSVKPKTVSLHSSSIAFALLIPALDCARSRRRHLTATPRLHRDYGALSVLHLALHHPLSLSLSAAIGHPTLRTFHPDLRPSTDHPAPWAALLLLPRPRPRPWLRSRPRPPSQTTCNAAAGGKSVLF